MEAKSGNKTRYRPVITVRMAGDNVFFGPGVAMLLKELISTGTMKDACRISKLSYSKAWKILNTAEKELGFPLVQRLHGGKNGGGCIVTEQGKELMSVYSEVDRQIKEYAQKLFENMNRQE